MTNLTDQINSEPLPEVALAAFKAIDVLQNYRPGTQVSSIAILLNLLCRAHNLDPRKALEAADNRVTRGFQSNIQNQHVRGLLHYCKVDLNANKE